IGGERRGGLPIRWTKKLGALGGAVIVALGVSVGVGLAVSKAAPSNTSLPSISGSARDGSILSASRGSWDNNPSSYAYQWLRCDSYAGSSGPLRCASARRHTVAQPDAA